MFGDMELGLSRPFSITFLRASIGTLGNTGKILWKVELLRKEYLSGPNFTFSSEELETRR